MKYLLALLLALNLYAETVTVDGVLFSYKEQCYNTSMELTFYRVTDDVDNNESMSEWVSDRYEPCMMEYQLKGSDLYLHNGYAKHRGTSEPVCSERDYLLNKHNCEYTKRLTKKDVEALIRNNSRE